MHKMANEPASNHRRPIISKKIHQEISGGREQVHSLRGSPSSSPLARVSGQPIASTGNIALTTQLVVKRAADIVVSLVGLLILSPVFLIAWLAMRRSGPDTALLTRDALGVGGKSIRVFALRRSGNVRQAFSPTKADQASLPSFGHLLRTSEIEGLPRLFNILRGDLSFVGLRLCTPASQEAVDSPDHQRTKLHGRFAMRPGLLNLAHASHLQAKIGAGSAQDSDLSYVENYSLWLDLRIIAAVLRIEIFKS